VAGHPRPQPPRTKAPPSPREPPDGPFRPSAPREPPARSLRPPAPWEPPAALLPSSTAGPHRSKPQERPPVGVRKP
jgi:hypothetical protein